MSIIGINPKGDSHSPYMAVICADRAEWRPPSKLFPVKRSGLLLYKKLIEGGEVYIGEIAPARCEQDGDLDALMAIADAAETSRAVVVCIDCANGQHEVSGHPDCTCACHGNGAAL